MPAFANFQPEYAAHKVACFPVDRDTKKPSIRNYDKIGLSGSAQLISRFPYSDALGFCAGQRSRLTVLDVDEPGKAGERILSDLGSVHGQSRFIVRTSGGKFHAYYRYNGEERKIRPYPDKKVDVLGGGCVIAAPSRMTIGNYEIIQGCFDDLDALTPLVDLPCETTKSLEGVVWKKRKEVAQGERNAQLFRYCLRVARGCDTIDDLLDEARTFCGDFMDVSLPESEIVATAKSAWGYEQRGDNWLGKGRENAENWLMDNNLDAYNLYKLARRFNSGKSEFHMTWNMGERFGWRREKLAPLRKFLIEHGFIRLIRQRSGKSPAVYGWGSPSVKA